MSISNSPITLSTERCLSLVGELEQKAHLKLHPREVIILVQFNPSPKGKLYRLISILSNAGYGTKFKSATGVPQTTLLVSFPSRIFLNAISPSPTTICSQPTSSASCTQPGALKCGPPTTTLLPSLVSLICLYASFI